jgi:hypothetical protein
MPTILGRSEPPEFPFKIQSQDEKEIEQTLFQKAKTRFAACMNEPYVESLGKYPLYSILQHRSHSLSGSKLDSKELADFMIDHKKLLIDPVFGRHPADPNYRIFQINQGEQILSSPGMYKDTTTRALFLETVENLLSEMHGPTYVPFARLLKQHSQANGMEHFQDDASAKSNQADPSNDPNHGMSWKSIAKGIMDFEINLADIRARRHEKHSDVISVLRIDLDKTYSNLGLEGFITKSLQRYHIMFKPESIVIAHPGYLTALNDVLESASPEILNYWGWVYLLKQNLQYVNFDTRKIWFRLQAHLDGKSVEELKRPRREICINAVLGNQLGGRWYVATKFPELARTRVLDMVHGTKSSFKMRLNDIAWLDEATRNEALKKLDRMKALIGFNEMTTNMIVLAKLYLNYALKENDYFGNELRAEQDLWVQRWEGLDGPPASQEGGTRPNEANAGYHPYTNAIVRTYSYQSKEFQSKQIKLALLPDFYCV